MFGNFLATLFACLLPLSAAELKIAVLHPLLGDLARQVGGGQVEVVDLIGPNADPHHFEPKPEDLNRARGASLYLVAGMGLEGYLPKLKAIIANHATLIEVGASLPALLGNGEFIRVSDAGESFARIKAAGKLPAGLAGEGELIFKTSMKQDDRFGDPEQTKLGPRYCWVVANVSKDKLEPAAKGVPADREFTTFSLTHSTSPDRTQLNFAAGVGITYYQYVRHGTACDCGIHLVETGDKAAEPGKPDRPQ